MPTYKAPLRDIEFVLHEVFDAEKHYQSLGFSDVNRELIDTILAESAKFTEQELDPIRHSGDEIGARLTDGKVVTPPGFTEAFNAYRENGWAAMSCATEWGGQGLPHSLMILFHEMAFTANVAWCAAGTLTHGAIRAIEAHASDELKAAYLPKLVSAEWTGTMCLTEPQAGSDVGLVKTRAEPENDGSYRITGTKIFITQGENDYSTNIIHLVLARLPDAPKGPKGISLFIVPKFLPTPKNEPGSRNAVSCGALEKKMGLKASPTCVLNFDGATGWMIGSPNGGLAAMFTMMNAARLDVGIEGLGAAELSFQGALAYARERLQMRAPTEPVCPEKPADPIIAHPDVRRMLMTQKALSEGCRALAYSIALALDTQDHASGDVKKQAADLIALLTPINKAFLTDRGLECANYGVQVFGGHGYICENGMEQIVRDVRIALIYEGTNGIQANDLIGRKLAGSRGKLVFDYIDQAEAFCLGNKFERLASMVASLQQHLKEWRQISEHILDAGKQGPNYTAAVAVYYLDYAGYVVLAYLWARMAQVAAEQLAKGTGNTYFYDAKLITAQFYFEQILPRTRSLVELVKASPASIMGLPEDCFGF
ncbi:Acyl-CoA dehydrogenase [gamma proteobacterium HdN1]|nr:Acyl-CoA dehydrogenase [gamma proteobacterium HdN1]